MAHDPTLFDPTPYEKGEDKSGSEWTHGSGRGAHHSVSGEQLGMFMSPREIMSQYQVLDADREMGEYYDDQDREGSLTNRSYTTMNYHGGQQGSAYPNDPIPSVLQRGEKPGSEVSTWSRNRMDWMQQRHGSELQRHKYTRTYVEPGAESDEEVWARKLDESQMNPMDYGDIHGQSETMQRGAMGPDTLQGRPSAPTPPSYPATPGPSAGSDTEWEHREAVDRMDESYERRMQSRLDLEEEKWESKYGYEAPSLFEKIQAQGVKSPVRLGTYGKPGSTGKPSVVGGHHRIAAAHAINPDQLIPVLHYEDIREAKSDTAYPYS